METYALGFLGNVLFDRVNLLPRVGRLPVTPFPTTRVVLEPATTIIPEEVEPVGSGLFSTLTSVSSGTGTATPLPTPLPVSVAPTPLPISVAPTTPPISIVPAVIAAASSVVASVLGTGEITSAVTNTAVTFGEEPNEAEVSTVAEILSAPTVNAATTAPVSEPAAVEPTAAVISNTVASASETAPVSEVLPIANGITADISKKIGGLPAGLVYVLGAFLTLKIVSL